jgi:hypothetical protein
VLLLAARALIHVLSLSGASAMGCHTYNIWQSFHSSLHKLISTSIKQPDSAPLKKKTSREEEDEESAVEMDTEDQELDIEIAFASQASTGTTRRSQRKTSSSSTSNRASADVCSSSASGIISKPIYKEFCHTLQVKVDVFLCVKDEDLLSSFADLLLQCLYFTAVRNDLQVCVSPLQDAITKFSTLSGNCLMFMHK